MLKEWEQAYRERMKSNYAWLRAILWIALLGWALCFIVLPLLRQP